MSSNFQCVTRLERRVATYSWMLRDFNLFLCRNEDPVTSASFPPSAPSCAPQWRLRLFPRGYDKESSDYISLFLMLARPPARRRTMWARSSFSLVDPDTGKEECIFSPGEEAQFSVDNSWGCRKFVARGAELRRILAQGNGTLNIHCKIEILKERIQTVENVSDPNIVPPCRYKEDLARLVNDSTFADVILLVENRELFGHAAILSARSPVLKSLLKAKMSRRIKDARKRLPITVQIDDVRYDVFKEVLIFLYSEETPHIKDMAEEVLEAAARLQIPHLKAVAESELSASVSVENVARRLILADRHDASLLKEKLLQFFRTQYVAAVARTEGWATLICSSPHLATEVLSSVSAFLPPPIKRRKILSSS